jgi:NADH-quinone oxidoreductase subunit J
VEVTFYVAAAAAILATGMVITRRHAVHALLWFVVSLFAVAVIFYTLGAPFVAALEVIVYAGAIMVLFIFVIMLLSVRYEESGEGAGIPTGVKRNLAVVLAALMVGLFAVLSWTFVLTGRRGGADVDTTSIEQLGLTLYRKYAFPFEVASILLLVAIIGAVAITRRHGRGMEGSVGVEES